MSTPRNVPARSVRIDPLACPQTRFSVSLRENFSGYPTIVRVKALRANESASANLSASANVLYT